MADLERCLQQAAGRAARASSWCSPTACSRWTAPSRSSTAMRALCDALRRAAGRRRMPRHRLHGRDRARHARAPRRASGRDRHHHRHARQGARRRHRRLHRRRGSEVVELLRQRSRPYLFSNTLAPAIVGASIAVLDLLEGSHRAARQAAKRTHAGSAQAIAAAGFDIKPGKHPIVPIMVYDAVKAQQLGRAPARARRLRRRLLLPGGAEGPGAHPRADERGARARASGAGGRRLRAGRARAGACCDERRPGS